MLVFNRENDSVRFGYREAGKWFLELFDGGENPTELFPDPDLWAHVPYLDVQADSVPSEPIRCAACGRHLEGYDG